MVAISALVLVGLVAGQTADFDIEGVRARAETQDPRGFLLQGRDLGANEWEAGTGMVTIDATDRARLPGALYGDRARVEASFRIGSATYRIVLDKPGFPPRKAGGRGLRPPHEVGGGVMTNVWINGPTGIGNVFRPSAHAAVVVWGMGRIERDGRLLSDSVMIEAGALNWGYHADDQTHRVLTAAREGDAEVYVRVTGIPRNREARGFMEISFDDVTVTVNGAAVATVRNIPSNVVSPLAMGGSGVAGGGGAPGTDQESRAAQANAGQGTASFQPNYVAQTTQGPNGAPLVPGTTGGASGDGAVTSGNAGDALVGATTGGQPAGTPAAAVASPRPQADPTAEERSRAPDDVGPIRPEPSQASAARNTGASNQPASPPYDTNLRTGVPGVPPGASTPNLGGNVPNPYASQRGFAGVPNPAPQPTGVTGGTQLTGTPGVTSAPASPELAGETGAAAPLTPSSPFGTFGVPGVTGFGTGTGGAGTAGAVGTNPTSAFGTTGDGNFTYGNGATLPAQNAGATTTPGGTASQPGFVPGTFVGTQAPGQPVATNSPAPVGSPTGVTTSPFTVTGAPSVSGFNPAGELTGAIGSAASLQNANGLPGTATTGTPPTPGTLAFVGAPTGSGFASPGLPGTPQILNGQPAAPLPRPELNINSLPAFGTPLPATPAPLNAAPAPAFPGTPTPLSSAPVNTVPSAVPGGFGVNALPGQLAPSTLAPAGTVPSGGR